jgi:hypothetical protein
MAIAQFLCTLTRSDMKKNKQSKGLAHTIFSTAIIAMLIGGLACTLCLAEPPSNAQQTNSVALKASSPGATKAPAKSQLTGAELYSINCNRCHPERYPTERTAAQWKTIMLHMQVRANIPVAQARLILKYLQDNSGR